MEELEVKQNTDQLIKSIIEELTSSFPKMWFKSGSKFNPDSDDFSDCIWTGEGSEIYDSSIKASIEVFDYYASMREQVFSPFKKYCEQKGLSIEFFDLGTVMLRLTNLKTTV